MCGQDQRGWQGPSTGLDSVAAFKPGWGLIVSPGGVRSPPCPMDSRVWEIPSHAPSVSTAASHRVPRAALLQAPLLLPTALAATGPKWAACPVSSDRWITGTLLLNCAPQSPAACLGTGCSCSPRHLTMLQLACCGCCCLSSFTLQEGFLDFPLS